MKELLCARRVSEYGVELLKVKKSCFHSNLILFEHILSCRSPRYIDC